MGEQYFLSFDEFVGTLVFFKLLNNQSLVETEPFVIVTVTYEMVTNNVVPQTFLASYRNLDHALSDMDLIDSGRCDWLHIHEQLCWNLTVLQMSYQGDTVVWRDNLPMTPVG